MATPRRQFGPSTFFYDFTPQLVSRMQRHGFDGPEVAAVWERYFADRNRADLHTLFDHYLQVVWCEARKAKRLAPTLFTDPLGDIVSDAALGLLNAIPLIKSFVPSVTRLYLMRGVRRQIWNECRARSWAGRRRTENVRTMQSIRAGLVAKLGRVPTREEIIEVLATRVKNPSIYFCYIDMKIPSVAQCSQLEKPDCGAVAAHEDARLPDPSDKAMDEEVMRLAMKKIHGMDRKIFRLLIDGLNPSEIARQIGMRRDALLKRLNGVLWEARCRADLAAYLEVEAATEPLRTPHGRLVTPHTVPAARMAG